MAPKKAAVDPKGKPVMRAGASAAVARSATLVEALPPTRVNAVAIAKVRHVAAAGTNEHGATEMRPSGSRLTEGFYPIFVHTLYAGLVPPFSEFQIGRAHV